MDSYTWFLFLGLMVVGGGIAFMGDRLGRYMGKRRLSICGLRPRHTALCFTIIAGVLIAITSLITMCLLSAGVRVALFQVNDLQNERAALTRECGRLKGENRSLVQRGRELYAEYERSRKRALEAAAEERRSREKLAQTLHQIQHARERAERGVALLRQEVAARSRLAAVKSREISRLTKRLQETQAEVKDVTARLADTRALYQIADTRYEAAAARYKVVSEEYRKMSAQLAEGQAVLASSRSDLQRLLGDMQRLRGQMVALEQAKVQLESSRDAVQAQLAILYQQQDQVLASYASQRVRNLIYTIGQELAREVVDGREPQARIRARLMEMVERTAAQAAQRGAGQDGKPDSAVTLVHRPDGAAEQKMFIDGRAIDVVTEGISRANTSVVVQFMAAANTVAGERVPVDIQLWPNRLVFHDGEEIARRVINGRQSTGQVLEELVMLLHSDVRPAAVSRGMVPRLVKGGPEANTEMGAVPLSRLVSTAEQVRKQRGNARVEVLAATDLWTADSMQITFRVSPATSPEPKTSGGSLLTVH